METKKIEDFVNQTNEKLSNIEAGLNEKVDEKKLNDLKDELQSVKQNIEEINKVGDKTLTDYVKGLQDHNDKLENRMKEVEESGGSKKTNSDLIRDSIKSELDKGRESFLNKLSTEEGIELKADTVSFGNSFTESYYEAIPQAQRLPGIQMAPYPTPTVYNLMNVGVTSRRYIPYVERTDYTSGASMVDDKTAGGQADISFEDKQATVKKISVNLYVSRDSIEDVDYLQSEIQKLLNHDIVQKRENQILTGTGAGNNLHGLVYPSDPVARAFAKPTGFDKQQGVGNSTVLHAALTQVMLGKDNNFETGYMANGIVVHPTAIANMIEDRDADNAFRKHPLLSQDGRTFNGVQIVPSKYIDDDTFLVGDFRQCKPFVRRNISLKILDQNGTYGESDVLTFVVTFRMAFFTPSPHDYAFSFGTFEAAKSALTETLG